MKTSKVVRTGIMMAVPAVFSAWSAAADVALSFGYNDLSGSYTSTSATTGSFTAVASDTPNLRSSGDVTRLIPTTGTAEFAPGFVSTAGNFVVNLSVFNINTIPGIADGTGNFVITDVNGDTLSGDIVGIWIMGGLDQTFFNGALFNVVFTNNSADGGIDGSSGDHVDGNLGFPFVYEGAVTQLFLNPGTPFFFDYDFQNVDTQVLGEIFPTPGAATLAGLAGLMVARRRRR